MAEESETQSPLTRPHCSWLLSPVWYAIVVLCLHVGPVVINGSQLLKLRTAQFGNNVYWISNAASVLQSLISAGVVAVAGYASQPHRLGRKKVIVYLSLIACLGRAVPVVTQNAYTITCFQIGLSVLGADAAPGAGGMFVTILSWCTDWCKPEEKMKYFSLLFGFLFGTISFVAWIPRWLQLGEGRPVFLFSLLASLANPVFAMLVFPTTTPYVEPSSPESLASLPGSSASNPVLESNGNVGKTVARVLKSLKYLFRTHFVVTSICLINGFADTALIDSIGLFLMKEREFDIQDWNLLMSVAGISGFVMQVVVVPILNGRGVLPQIILIISLSAMVLHMFFYACLSSKFWLFVLEPFGALGYGAGVSITTIVSGVSSREDIPHDQGSLLGTLLGLSNIANCVGPLALAGCITSWRLFPPPLNFAGFGFGILAFLMTIACLLAIRLYYKTLSHVSSAHISVVSLQGLDI